MTYPESEAFKKAATDVKKITSPLPNDDLLELYGLFKIGRDETPDKPGMFDLKGKAKYNAWQKLKDEGLSPQQAQERYVTKVEELKAKYGYDENKEPEAVGSSS